MILKNLAVRVEQNLQPEGRAAAMANTLRQHAGWAEAAAVEVSEEDLKAGYVLLSVAREGEEGPIAGRRKACGELAGLLEGVGGNASACIELWEVLHASAAKAAEAVEGGDPRLAAMAATYQRELEELRAS